MTDTSKSVVLDRELEEEKNQDSSGSRIRCPLCGWSPRREDKWFCTCGNEWNTFDTGGVCPACLHQWTETQCLSRSRIVATFGVVCAVIRDEMFKVKVASRVARLRLQFRSPNLLSL